MSTRVFAGMLLLAAGALAADQDFNGRWDITTTGQPRPRAMWLELTGIGSPNPAGKFVSDYNGDMNKVDHIAVENGELRFSFDRPGARRKIGAVARLPRATREREAGRHDRGRRAREVHRRARSRDRR